MEKILNEAYTYAKNYMGKGEIASYIPELANANPEHFAISATTLDGKTYSVGNSDVRFTIQSISKVILLISALEEQGVDKVFSHVGMEPTGDSFNSIVKLETVKPHRPLNPMINAGAISVTTLLKGNNENERFEHFLERARKLLNNPNLEYNHSVFLSEKQTGDRNRALAYMMKSDGVFGGDVDKHLEIYFKSCSVLANSSEISYLGAVLANNGFDPLTNKVLVSSIVVKAVRSLMATCGMYDASGEFALRVGVPSKSGVGGGIVSAAPNKLGLGVFCPFLDEKGNSICGVKALEFISHNMNLNIF